MNYEDLTIYTVRRLVEMLQRTSRNSDVIEAIVSQIELEPTPHDRVTIGSVIRLLNQTNGCTVLPEEIAALLNAPEPVLFQPDQPTISQRRARDIMGANMFGVQDAIHHFGLDPTVQQLTAMSEVPFTEKLLQDRKDSHVLVAVFPLSIAIIKNKITALEFDISNTDLPINDQGEPKWHLIRKTLVPGSRGITWNLQQQLLSENEVIPTAQVMVYTIVGHYLVTSERLFLGQYINTSTQLNNYPTQHVYIGFQTSRLTIHLGLFSKDNVHANLGIASALKP